MWTTPAFSTAASIFSASRRVLASGFSQSTALPARAAAIAISAWLSPGVLTSTRWMSFRATTSRQSVAVSSQPSWPAAALTAGRFRPHSTLRRGRRRGENRRTHLAVGVAVGAAHEGVADEGHPDLAGHRSIFLPWLA